MELPFILREALAAKIESLPLKNLAEAATELSARYRSGEQQREGMGFFRSPDDFTAYAASRMPATFAAVYSALNEVSGLMPDWQPNSLLDAGAGPGTASWAAVTIWNGLAEISLVEREESMIRLGKSLAAEADSEALRCAQWTKVDLRSPWPASPKDLVIASYSLNELPAGEDIALVRRLWDLTEGVLVIVEPGTHASHGRIKQFREILLTAGGYIAAPCPHASECPISGEDWCHFSKRVSRSRIHRQVKAGDLSYEDEKYSYLAVSRKPGTNIGGRVLRHPQVTKGYIRYTACTPGGLREITALRRDKDAYKRAKDLDWGSAIKSK